MKQNSFSDDRKLKYVHYIRQVNRLCIVQFKIQEYFNTVVKEVSDFQLQQIQLDILKTIPEPCEFDEIEVLSGQTIRISINCKQAVSISW